MDELAQRWCVAYAVAANVIHAGSFMLEELWEL
jgi:hypothetical protein